MADLSKIQPDMEIIGADGVHVGTVDHVDGDRIKMTRKDSIDGKHHWLSEGLIAEVEGNQVRLSATGANAQLFEEDEG